MIGFGVEAIMAWYHFDLANNPKAALAGEPDGVIISFIVAVAIMYFRFLDNRTIRNMITKEARSEVVTKIARTFLTIRDRSNTPLQTLILTTELLKKNKDLDPELIMILEKNLKRLKETNQILMTFEDRITWQGKDLMTDSEILQWLSEIHDK